MIAKTGIPTICKTTISLTTKQRGPEKRTCALNVFFVPVPYFAVCTILRFAHYEAIDAVFSLVRFAIVSLLITSGGGSGSGGSTQSV